MVSPFGLFVMGLLAGLFTAPSWQTFTVLVYGWAVASGERQTITTYLWLTGATTMKHFSCYYTFLGGALYQARWQLWARILRRDSNAFTGLGQDQCRKYARVVGANTFRLVLAAVRTLWFVEQARRTADLDLIRYRPWDRHKVAPSQRDIVWTWRETLHAAGVFPIPRFTADLAEIPQKPENVLLLAA